MRYVLDISYKGSNYAGWQIQENAFTVQEELEQALSTVLAKKISVLGAGRTDAGVHASGQTAHLDLPEETDIYKLIHGVNGLVGDSIHIKHIEPVKPDFHARFDALTRKYQYTVLAYPSPLM